MPEAQAQLGSWLDRAVGFLAPRAGLKRLRARLAADLLARHYEAAAIARRTQGWNRTGGDVNTVVGGGLANLRNVARDLVRNNGYAESALGTITDHVVGWGIVAKPRTRNKKAADLWKAWAETTACDSDGQNDFYGLQELVMRTVVESGECLVRRRFRREEDQLPIPIQLQVLDPDYIDTMKNQPVLSSDGKTVARIVHGVEFDLLGRRIAYWLFAEHPGAETATFGESHRVPAEGVLHVYRKIRPGQVRAVSWFATVLLKFKDFDEYEDATLMKQKIAACLAVITSDPNDTGAGLGATDDAAEPATDSLEPGMIIHAEAGRAVTVVDPPSVREHADYCATTLRGIATGLGVAYEDLTGDYTGMPFSAARMSRIRHWARVERWRWRMLIPMFCDPVWAWAQQAMTIMNVPDVPGAKWTAPPAPMIDPSNEGLAYQRNIRTGLQSWQESVRERGYDPDEVAAEIAADNKRFDKLGIVLDSDPRRTSQAGNPTQVPAAAPPAVPPAEDPDEEEEEERHGSKSTKSRQSRERPGSRKP